MSKRVEHAYSVEVYESKYDGYVAWGVSYPTKEQCLAVVKKYINDCLTIYNKHKHEEAGKSGALRWLQQYKDFTEHSITLVDRKFTIEEETTTRQINILEVK